MNPIKKYLKQNEKAWLRELEKQSNQLLDRLAKEPSNSKLVTLLNEIDIKIVTLTQEHTIEY